MASRHPKSVRRRLLSMLYDRYLQNPLDMPAPADLLEDGTITREELVANAHYLNDRGLIELMMGYSPPMFVAARITAKGIDLVENHFEFNLLFPGEPGPLEDAVADVPVLLERLIEEVDYVELDGEARRALLRDAQYLREEIARPVTRWRPEVIGTVMEWIVQYFDDADAALPTLPVLRSRLLKNS